MGGRKRGQVIIMFVLALFVLVGFVALGIDVGYMYSVRNDLQRSVDSGALAGAFAFHDGGW
ncbi:MAG: Tad domain-containing protein, partial [Candidatus Deferrimicrobiaceae bacterium]